jgi:plasmid stability protein
MLAMTDVMIRDLDDQTATRLQARADAHGRTLEAEVKAVLRNAADQADHRTMTDCAVSTGWATSLALRWAAQPVDDQTWQNFEHAMAEAKTSAGWTEVEFDR